MKLNAWLRRRLDEEDFIPFSENRYQNAFLSKIKTVNILREITKNGALLPTMIGIHRASIT
jgi:hypothetical protein